MPKPVTKILFPLNESWEDMGWRIELSYRLKMSGGGLWAASISHRRMTKSGSMKEGKPEHVLTLCEDDPIKLLRQVADLFEMGEVEAP
jgi:hypothetical protein